MRIKFLNVILTLSTLSFFAGCSTKSDTVIGPDGNADQRIKCSGKMDSCYSKARSICKGPYTVEDTKTYNDPGTDAVFYSVIVHCVP